MSNSIATPTHTHTHTHLQVIFNKFFWKTLWQNIFPPSKFTIDWYVCMVMAYWKCSMPEDGAESPTMIRHLQQWLEKIWLINESSNYKCLFRVHKFTKKSTSHLQILGARSKFHTEDQQFSSDVCGRHRYLALSAGFMSTDTHFCMVWRNIYAENLCHCRKFGCLEILHPLCLLLYYSSYLRYLVSLVEMLTTDHQ